MILITGATGRTGRRVVEHLLAAHQPIRVIVRDQEKAQRLLPSGVEIFEGDLSDRDLVRSAVDGTRSVMLLSPVAPAQVELQGNVVQAALATTRPYVVKISGLGTAVDSYVDSGRWHAETERQIETSGLSYTFLRPLFFMQNLAFLLDSARSKGVIRAGVGDAGIAMVDVEDVAEVVARLLIDRELLVNQAVTLTGSESVTYHDVARTLAEVLGHEVRYQKQSLIDVKRALQNSGQPQWHVNILLQFNRAFLEGDGEVANDMVADVLGRSPVTLLQYLRREVEHAERDGGNNPFPS